jgi:putative transposase
VQDDHHLLTVMRYAEANPLRSKMVEKSEAWRWSSFGGGTAKDGTRVQLEPRPVDKPSDWAAVANEPMEPAVLERVRLSVKRGRPYGTEPWMVKTVKRLGLESTLRDPWRPNKTKKKGRTAKRRVPRK